MVVRLLVEGTGDGSEGGDPRGERRVAGQGADDDAAAVGLAGGVVALGLDAEGALEVGEEVGGECEVVDCVVSVGGGIPVVLSGNGGLVWWESWDSMLRWGSGGCLRLCLEGRRRWKGG